MEKYQKLNNIIGWGVFAISLIVYTLTLEPTASFWDCGEFIATAFKLQVGHPPGAPLFQMLGRFFSLFAFGDTSKVAYMINFMSALSSAFTILFLYWSITLLAKKIATANGEMNLTKMFSILGSGIVGALAYTFSDSFWFSAVEAEVYAMSSLSTAFVFWAILKWESQYDRKDNLKWLVMIAYVMGLSIGVHLLNLLTIPAIVFVFYFKKFKPSFRGIIVVGVISILLLALVQNIIIPGVIKVDWWFEKFFVNSLGLPFHTGTIIYFILLIGGIIYGLMYTQKHKKVIANTIILCFTFLIIGYSSFMMLVIRSNANTPINENTPKDALGLAAYLAREQYGDWPLLKGPYYNAPVIDAKDGNPVYNKDHETGKYVITNPRTALIPVYDPEFTTIFPRMHSGREESHVSAYKQWGKVKGVPIKFTGSDGKTEIIEKPTFGENLRFFFSYQVGHMYMRYFMWNFAGRQNDIQGHGGVTEGNWLSGINFIDQIFLGPRYNVPDHLKNNPGHNKFYMLPLLLGLIGFFFHVKKNYKDTIVVGLLFVLTGLAIIIYLNQTPYQPRERDYAYAASFYAFAIWIGLGVMAISDAISKYLKGKLAPIVTTIVTLALVPGIMAAEGWDDHDRSNRYTARDIASNYLESCAPNAIIFTNGDNDTFPLWYVQEVENMRPDIKIVNLSLLNTDWYIDYMIRHKTYDAEPLPFTMKPIQYRDGTRDMVYMMENENIIGYTNLMDVIQFVASDNIRTKVPTQRGPEDYFPTKKFSLPVDSAKVVANGTVAPEDAHLIVKNVEWKIDRYGLQKNHLMALDFLATNNWDRPVYFAITTGGDSYLGLEEYFQLEGMAYRLVPIKHTNEDGQIGRINTTILYNNVMNKFKWGNMNQDGVYMNEDNIRLSTNIKNVFARLALALISENKNDSAIAVLDKAIEMMPENKMPFNYYNLLMAEAYYKTGAFDKGNAIIERMIDVNAESLAYFFTFPSRFAGSINYDKQSALAMLQRIVQVTDEYKQEEQANLASEFFDMYYQKYMGK